MGTEKFIAFKEDGSAYRLKGRILRFLDNEPVSEADKTNIRSTLSVPASAEGLTPANNLSDLSNVATARTNLGVNSIDEDAQANALKTTSPALYFNGTASVVTVAHDSRFNFTDGVNDLPFSMSAWAYVPNPAQTVYLVAKWGTGVATQEWLFATNTSGQIRLTIGDGTSSFTVASTDTIPSAGWYHFAVSYAGSGPNSTNSFNNAVDGLKLFINGVESSVSGTTTGYTGQNNTIQTVRLGAASNLFSKGSIRDVKIFNRELTASEIAQLARGNDLGFVDEWGGANGSVYSSDFTSDSVDSFTATGGAVDATTSVGGEGDNIQLTVNTATSSHYLQSANLGLVFGKRYRVTFDYYLPSSNSNMLGIRLNDGSNGTAFYVNDSATQDAWTRVSAEGVIISTTLTGYLQFRGRGGGSNTFTDAGGDDTLAIRNVTVTEIGTLADFRAEDYNESANKLLDRSSNNFVGVGTSVTLTGNQRHISADTIDLKNLPTSSAGLSAGEVWSNGGVLTVV